LLRGAIGPLPELVKPLQLQRGGELLVILEAAGPGRPGDPGASDPLARPPRIPCTLPQVFEGARPQQHIWFDDGRIGGIITDCTPDWIRVEITRAAAKGSKLRAGKGINLPETRLPLSALTAKDREDLRRMAPYIDLIGLSFLHDRNDILELQQELQTLGLERVGTVRKIETREAFQNLPQILLTSMRHPPVGLMLARGDLAVEAGFERLAELQEEVLWLAAAAHVPLIWATQVLEQMANQGAPTRAEVSDAALSVRAECVMLNKGTYIVDTVPFLNGVMERMSGHLAKRRLMLRRLAVSELKPLC